MIPNYNIIYKYITLIVLSVWMKRKMFFCMDPSRVVSVKSWDPISVLPEKQWDLTKLYHKGLGVPTIVNASANKILKSLLFHDG